jgi:hypothetical protein
MHGCLISAIRLLGHDAPIAQEQGQVCQRGFTDRDGIGCSCLSAHFHPSQTFVDRTTAYTTAELGGASGASVNIVSKSGSNLLHGRLYGFFRNDAMDARDPFAFGSALARGQTFDPALSDSVAPAIKNSFSREQFGGTIGSFSSRQPLR